MTHGRALRFALAMAIGAGGPALAQKASGSSPLLPGGDARAPVNVNADRLEFFNKEQKAVYSGHVFARQGQGSLRASRLTIYFSKAAASSQPSGLAGTSASQIDRMEASGPVTIVDGDEVGVGDEASYSHAANKVVLTGDVSLTQGPDIVKGDRLVYDLSSGQAQVVGRVTSLFLPSKGNSPDGDLRARGARRAHGPTDGRR